MKAKILNNKILIIPENEKENLKLINTLMHYETSGEMYLDPFNLVVPLKKIKHHEK